MPKKLEDCVRDVRRKGSAVNPWAVCNASIHKKMRGRRGKAKRGGCLLRPPFYGMRGRGFFGDLWNTAKSIGKTAITQALTKRLGGRRSIAWRRCWKTINNPRTGEVMHKRIACRVRGPGRMQFSREGRGRKRALRRFASAGRRKGTCSSAGRTLRSCRRR